MRDVAVVVPAGGSGTRLGGTVPKQFRALHGEPILVTTVRHFVRHPAVSIVVVAAPAAHVERTRRLLDPLRRGARGSTLRVVEGGAERQESVWRGLAAVPPSTAHVLVHDAVRPFVTRGLIDRVRQAARDGGAALCALPVAETVKRVRDGIVVETLDRRGLWSVQTPQGFRADLLREAHDKARRDGVTGTDDAMLVERLGHPVRVVEGSVDNVKITTPADLLRARRTAKPTSPSPRAAKIPSPGRRAAKSRARAPERRSRTRAAASRKPRARTAAPRKSRARAAQRKPRARTAAQRKPRVGATRL